MTKAKVFAIVIESTTPLVSLKDNTTVTGKIKASLPPETKILKMMTNKRLQSQIPVIKIPVKDLFHNPNDS
jgi:hypothetical protein